MKIISFQIELHLNTSIKRVWSIFHFIQIEWVSKIRGDIPSDNKRLRANNLKKVSNAIEEYNSEVLGIHFNSDFVHPDVTRAAEGNRQEMGMSISSSLTIIDSPCLNYAFDWIDFIKTIYFLWIVDAGRLIQLILGCAVNCDAKQQYIEGIMNMEESLQQLIMQAIQELLAHQVDIFLLAYNFMFKERFLGNVFEFDEI